MRKGVKKKELAPSLLQVLGSQKGRKRGREKVGEVKIKTIG